jgi:hypothetical protein
VFKTDKHVLLDVVCSLDPHPKFRPHGLKVDHLPPESGPWEQRLLRDEWRLIERGFDPRTHQRIGEREIWEKEHPDKRVKLCREVEDVDFGRYGGPYFESFWLECADDLIPLSEATWAEWDDWDRLVFVRHGKLYQAAWEGNGLREAELFDFNPLRPEEVGTPDWARRW